jgi:hypothetical protein
MKNSAKPVTTCQYQSVLHVGHVLAVRAVLAVARRELAQRERGVRDKEREHRADDQ